MDHSSTASSEISFVQHHDDGTFKKTVRKVTIILSVVTIIELLCGLAIFKLGHGSHTAVLMIKGLVTILSLAKAFYITSYFMHLGDEIRNFIMTIIVPLLLVVWFITALLIEGNSWNALKNTQAGSKPAATEQVEEGVKPGAKK